MIRFHKDAQRAYIQTNKGDLDLMTLALLDPATGQLETVESDPLQRVDFGSAWFSEATDELVETEYSDDRDRRYFKDPAFEVRLSMAGGEVPRAGNLADLQHAGRRSLADRRARRHGTGRNVPVRAQNARALVPIQDPRKIAARIAGADAGGPLQILRWAGDSCLFDAAEGSGTQGPARLDCRARRPMGAR